MGNRSLQVEEIKDYMRRGYPEGIEVLLKSMPVLFGRIEELERALVPFARKGVDDNGGLPLLYVNHSDCKKAYGVLSSDMASGPKTTPEPEYWPAE